MLKRLGAAEYRGHLKDLDRRSFLRAGMLGAAGVSLSSLLRMEAHAVASKKQTSVIILWMRGGPSQHETWDPKPQAPAEIRGPLGSIPSKVPGIRLNELLPRSAAIMNKWSIIRSLHHEDAGHSGADQICFTGYPPGPNVEVNVMPSCGSIVSKQMQDENPKLPSYVMIPRMVPGTDASYLGPAYRPFETQADPAEGGAFQVPNLDRKSGLSVERLAGRRELLGSLDQIRRDVDASRSMEAMDQF